MFLDTTGASDYGGIDFGNGTTSVDLRPTGGATATTDPRRQHPAGDRPGRSGPDRAVPRRVQQRLRHVLQRDPPQPGSPHRRPVHTTAAAPAVRGGRLHGHGRAHLVRPQRGRPERHRVRDNFGLFCSAFPNNTEPTGLTTTAPSASPIEPVVATGKATITPPPPVGPGGVKAPTSCSAPRRRSATWCSTRSRRPPPCRHPTQRRPAIQRDELPVPGPVAGHDRAAAAAIGNTSLTGTATGTTDALGASPASIPTGPLTFDVPIPSPVPPSGVPHRAVFSHHGRPLHGDEQLHRHRPERRRRPVPGDSGSSLDLKCTAYPDDSAPPASPPARPTRHPSLR